MPWGTTTAPMVIPTAEDACQANPRIRVKDMNLLTSNEISEKPLDVVEWNPVEEWE